ncbi:MAG: site-specific DNA-methyltransferase [Candidatus Heimdallarchaeota archaeon]|nr:site-specific DNA-methyltransferase [Candidatus Heimdallarchaeota archaeon]
MVTSHKIVIGDSKQMDLDSSSVDLVVTSPPYPMIEMWDELFSKMNPRIDKELKAGNGYKAFDLMIVELEQIWLEVDRVLKPGGFVCINIGDATRNINKEFRLYSNHSAIIRFFQQLNYDVLPSIIWRKQTNKPNKFMGSGMYPNGAYVTLEHEFILIFRKLPRRKLTDLDKDIRRRSAIFWEERNLWYSDIWFDLKGTGQLLRSKNTRSRSAAYPLEIPYRLISMYSAQGDTVLDPFLGTGTTTKAAMLLGRNSIGVEIDETLEHSSDGIHANFGEIQVESDNLVASRLEEHRVFMDARVNGDGKESKHFHPIYNFQVVTAQETDIYLPIIEKIQVSGSEYKIFYK